LLWLAVLVVGLFGSAYVVTECTGAQCCFDDYMRNIGRCHTKWGAPISRDSETENQATSREMTLRACLEGAGYDSPHPDHLQRVQGTIQLNGLAAVDELALNGESHRIEVPVTLEEGRNTLSVEINQVDDSWLGFATLVLRNW
jgi:hypothetical protein